MVLFPRDRGRNGSRDARESTAYAKLRKRSANYSQKPVQHRQAGRDRREWFRLPKRDKGDNQQRKQHHRHQDQTANHTETTRHTRVSSHLLVQEKRQSKDHSRRVDQHQRRIGIDERIRTTDLSDPLLQLLAILLGLLILKAKACLLITKSKYGHESFRCE